MNYVVSLQLEEDEMEDGRRAFSVTCPQFPAVCTYGLTREEALTNGREAVEAYLGYLHDKGERRINI
jgi:predicted RNase H-like HicB family nuclease